MIRKRLRLPILILFATVALYACVLIPLLQYLINDVVLSTMLVFDALDLLSRHLEIVASILLLEFLVFAVYRYRLSGARQPLILAACVLGFKYLAAVVTYSIAFGSLDLTGGLTPYLVSLLLELALAIVILFFSVQTITPIQSAFLARRAAAETLQREFGEQDPCYPFPRLFSWKNPVLRMTFVCVLAVFVLQSTAFIISFVSGAPMQAGDIPVMLAYEAVLILLPCAYSYFIAIPFFKLCVRQSNRPLSGENT